jgi:hypothetical protein
MNRTLSSSCTVFFLSPNPTLGTATSGTTTSVERALTRCCCHPPIPVLLARSTRRHELTTLAGPPRRCVAVSSPRSLGRLYRCPMSSPPRARPIPIRAGSNQQRETRGPIWRPRAPPPPSARASDCYPELAPAAAELLLGAMLHPVLRVVLHL